MRIAVTGGIASGKSTIVKMLRDRGISTLSADALAGDILWSTDVQQQLMQAFGVTEAISPVVLKALLAQDDQSRRQINRILHPIIAEEISRSSAIVVEVPLLFETCLHVNFQAIWVANCKKETQLSRLQERYGASARFDQISWQLDSKVALSFADSVIQTDVSEDETFTTLLQEAKRWGVSLAVS
jgi:dephospho-CoA kinase